MGHCAHVLHHTGTNHGDESVGKGSDSERRSVDSDERTGITYTDRFPKPKWIK